MTSPRPYSLTVDNILHHIIQQVSLTYCFDSRGAPYVRITQSRKSLPIGTPASMNVVPGSPAYKAMLHKGICAGGRFLYFSQLKGLREFDKRTVSVARQSPGALVVTGYCLPGAADELAGILTKTLHDQMDLTPLIGDRQPSCAPEH